jgi:hypothetical protein
MTMSIDGGSYADFKVVAASLATLGYQIYYYGDDPAATDWKIVFLSPGLGGMMLWCGGSGPLLKSAPAFFQEYPPANYGPHKMSDMTDPFPAGWAIG